MSETVFKQVNYDLMHLVKSIRLGEIGLPDIQRPFVWKNSKVRDLFDSMYKGYPVGYLLLWQNANDDGAKAIGLDQKQKTPSKLIVDGQQRLTSLYAVVNGLPVVREDFSEEPIRIAFNPLEEKFEVADAAIRRDKTFIPNISNVWSEDSDIFEIVDTYLEGVSKTREIGGEERKQIRSAIQKLYGLESFPFTALELAADIDEEQVSDVFVRINSQGKMLNQADFILTLMSVFWDEGRTELEDFCRAARIPSKANPSPYNHFIEPDPDQLLRVNVGVGFRRGRLKHVYSILRGKDLETGEFSADRREKQFGVLKQAQQRTVNLQHWHDFFKVLLQAGYRSKKMISSQTGVLFTYMLYLLGRTEYGVDEFTLRRVLAKWFFMSALTGRFSGSPESKMEFDLARLREVSDADGFVQLLDRLCDNTLTSDFWSITLPNELATSSGRSPALFAYYAAANLLDANVLYSKRKVQELLDPITHANRAAIERHHLFPRKYLQKNGVANRREINQIANYALVEWMDNKDIADRSPADYVPNYAERFSRSELRRMYHAHGLPDGWESMPYGDFLVRRRELLASVIQEAYETLSTGLPASDEPTLSIGEFVDVGEGENVEFKATLRTNLHTGQKDKRMEDAIVRTVAGFLNSSGGTLIIGVEDNGDPLGVEADGFPNEDKMSLHLTNLLSQRIGPQHMMYVHPRFEDYEGVRVLAVECSAARSPIYVKNGNQESFFVRATASTRELRPSETQQYVKQHFS